MAPRYCGTNERFSIRLMISKRLDKRYLKNCDLKNAGFEQDLTFWNCRPKVLYPNRTILTQNHIPHHSFFTFTIPELPSKFCLSISSVLFVPLLLRCASLLFFTALWLVEDACGDGCIEDEKEEEWVGLGCCGSS